MLLHLLLSSAVRGENPFEGMIPSVPDGESLEYDTPDFLSAEEEGFCEGSLTSFVLVAGGLGERLGYSGIKLALPVETTTGQCYLEYYINYILALQSKCRKTMNNPNITIDLAIMTSDDTDVKVSSSGGGGSGAGSSGRRRRRIGGIISSSSNSSSSSSSSSSSGGGGGGGLSSSCSDLYPLCFGRRHSSSSSSSSRRRSNLFFH